MNVDSPTLNMIYVLSIIITLISIDSRSDLDSCPALGH